MFFNHLLKDLANVTTWIVTMLQNKLEGSSVPGEKRAILKQRKTILVSVIETLTSNGDVRVYDKVPADHGCILFHRDPNVLVNFGSRNCQDFKDGCGDVIIVYDHV